MGKGDRKGKNRQLWARKDPGAWSPPELAPVASSRNKQERTRQGRFASPPAEDARLSVLQQRARHLGIEEPGRDARRRMTAVWLEHDIGLVMERELKGNTSAIARLWATWADLSAAHRTYSSRVLDIHLGPKGSNMPLLNDRPPDRPEDAREDLRTDEERTEDAKSSWKAWTGRLDAIFWGHRSVLIQALSGHGKPLWVGKRPTTAGLQVLAALQHLTDRIERER